MHLTAMPALDNFPELRYFLNDVPITPKEAKMMQLIRRNSWTDELTAADFIDFKEVKKILGKVGIKQGHNGQSFNC